MIGTTVDQQLSFALGVYYFSAIIIVSIATAMSVASLNLYHHGKHHIHPVPKWIGRLFFFIVPKLLFMNLDLPSYLKQGGQHLLNHMVSRIAFLDGIGLHAFVLVHNDSLENARQEEAGDA